MAKRIDTAVILAAGRGARLKPYTNNYPKGFVKINNETLIKRSIRILRNAGIKRILVGVGYMSEMYEEIANDLGIETYYNREYGSSESYYTLFLAKDLIESDFLLLESDLLYNSQAIQRILNSPYDNTFLASGFTNSGDEVYLKSNERDEVTGMSQEPIARADAAGELVGISKFSIDFFKNIVTNTSNEADLKKLKYEFAMLKYQKGDKIKLTKDETLVWCEIDNEEHLERAKQKIFPRL
ncbi:MAG: phosphocholine cytidylyltransferase family protein [Cyclobacteriaceae bacterium]